MAQVEIKVNPKRDICGISKARECVAKNFADEYPGKTIYELNRLCCGVLVEVEHNGLFTLYKSTASNYDYDWYIIADNVRNRSRLEIEVCHGAKVSLTNDGVLVTDDESEWWYAYSGYELDDPKLYRLYIKPDLGVYAGGVKTDFNFSIIESSHEISVCKTPTDYKEYRGFREIVQMRKF